MENKTDLKRRKKIYCDVCNTFISSEVLLVMHNNGKKHQRLVKVREERKSSTERSIYVRGFENKTTLESDLNEYFTQFGKVSSIFVDKEKAKYAIVEFECPGEVQAILSSKQLPLFSGKYLIIKKRTFKEPMQKSPKRSEISTRKEKVSLGRQKIGSFLEEGILDRIECSSTLNEQMLEVVSSTSLTDDDLKLRSLIVEYLQEIFIEIFPACVLTPFGSTATGLGLKGADMDLCLLVDHEALNVVLNQDNILPSSSDLTKRVLEFIVNILRKFAAGIQNVVSVSTTKCPVVKFNHRDSGLSCDLSINNRLAIRNTELIQSYLALDDRIRPLAITLKNWGAAKRLVGSGGRQISNYCLVLMLLHFLQRTRPPVIPVLQLARDNEEMRDAEDTEKMIIDGWDCSFVSTVAETSQNKDSLGTLLEDWFHYYGTTFDYVNEVIAIQRDINQHVVKPGITTESVSRVSVKSATFKPSVLCVQDPLELSHNLTQNVSEETLENFIQSCRKAFTILSNKSEQTNDTRATKTSPFMELFTITVDTNQRSRKSYSFTIPYVSSTTLSYTPLQQTGKFIADLLSNHLQMSCEFQPGTDEYSTAEDAIPKDEILTKSETGDDGMCVDEDTAIDNKDIFGISRKRTHEEKHCNGLAAKRMKTDNQNEMTSLAFLCAAKQITWQNRRRQRRQQTANDEGYRRESAETEEAGIHSDEAALPILQNVSDQLRASTSRMEVSHNTVGVSVLEFKLTINEQNNQGLSLSAHPQCNVVLTHLRGLPQHFANFFAFFKKFVVQNITECQ